MSEAVLYDAAGPRGRRRILVGSVLAVVLVLAPLVGLVIWRLEETGQFRSAYWEPFGGAGVPVNGVASCPLPSLASRAGGTPAAGGYGPRASALYMGELPAQQLLRGVDRGHTT